jgi:hypothetical protein
VAALGGLRRSLGDIAVILKGAGLLFAGGACLGGVDYVLNAADNAETANIGGALFGTACFLAAGAFGSAGLRLQLNDGRTVGIQILTSGQGEARCKVL